MRHGRWLPAMMGLFARTDGPRCGPNSGAAICWMVVRPSIGTYRTPTASTSPSGPSSRSSSQNSFAARACRKQLRSRTIATSGRTCTAVLPRYSACVPATMTALFEGSVPAPARSYLHRGGEHPHNAARASSLGWMRLAGCTGSSLRADAGRRPRPPGARVPTPRRP